jgi:hypothetical protein
LHEAQNPTERKSGKEILDLENCTEKSIFVELVGGMWRNKTIESTRKCHRLSNWLVIFRFNRTSNEIGLGLGLTSFIALDCFHRVLENGHERVDLEQVRSD